MSQSLPLTLSAAERLFGKFRLLPSGFCPPASRRGHRPHAGPRGVYPAQAIHRQSFRLISRPKLLPRSDALARLLRCRVAHFGSEKSRASLDQLVVPASTVALTSRCNGVSSVASHVNVFDLSS